MTDQNKQTDKLSFLNTMKSTAMAALGVQTQKNRERDFSKGKPAMFIAAGLIFALIFILSVYSVVQIVLSSAGSN